MASKFSSEKPSGSTILWQVAQVAFCRCRSSSVRIVSAFEPSLFSLRAGTLGGGAMGVGGPRMFSKIHLPRSTGELRLG